MTRIRTGGLMVSALLASLAAGVPGVQAEKMTPSAHTSCDAVVDLTDAAEKRMGGALYEGALEGVQTAPETTAAMPGMAGAHEVHMGRQGGAFFMAPNKIHHIEARYSEECGIQLFVYNAYTEAIGVERFQAFVKIVPDSDNEWDKEVIRFLSPAAAGGVLRARGDHEIEGSFRIELYVRFPESDDAEMFNVPVGAMAH